MTFVTVTFFLFLMVTFGLHWAARSKRGQNICLLVASYVFYGWWDWRFCFLLLGSSLVDYVVGAQLARTEAPRRRRLLLITSLVMNLGVLGFFKYTNFFIDSAVDLLTALGLQANRPSLDILLPVGISFFTFQTLSYTIDIYRRRLEPARDLIDYCTFVAFFPQLVAGPIERASHLVPALSKRRVFDYEQAVRGCQMILWGMFMKSVIADNLAMLAESGFDVPGRNGPQLVVATVSFAIQIYGDFAGYSAIAIGTSRLFGVELMRNFAYPYFSQDIGEFWRRWHISLSTWFRDYVYIPLGGSRVGRGRLMANLLITFGLSGLWHGASWNFVIWGLLNGAAIALLTLFARSQRRNPDGTPGGEHLIPRPSVLGRLLVCNAFICLTWIFFRSADFGQSLNVIRRIAVDVWQPSMWNGLTLGLDSAPLTVLLAVIAIGAEWLNRRRECPLSLSHAPRWLAWSLYMLVFWACLLLQAPQPGQFIYFQF